MKGTPILKGKVEPTYGTSYDVGYEMSDFSRTPYKFPKKRSDGEARYFAAFLIVQRSGEVNMISSNAVGIRMKAIMGLTDDEFLRQQEKASKSQRLGNIFGTSLNDHMRSAARSFAHEENYHQMMKKYPNVYDKVLKEGVTFEELPRDISQWDSNPYPLWKASMVQIKTDEQKGKTLESIERQKKQARRTELLF